MKPHFVLHISYIGPRSQWWRLCVKGEGKCTGWQRTPALAIQRMQRRY